MGVVEQFEYLNGSENTLNTLVSGYSEYHNVYRVRVVLENFVCTESRELLSKNVPRCFAQYAMCRYVLDCTEIPVCSPRCIWCQTQTYSHYKSRYTLKVLLAVSPSGLITFVSPFFGGKASDKFILILAIY